MKVPKYIETAIERAGKSSKVNRDNSEIVRIWLEKQGLVDENFENLTENSVADYVIDCIENGVDGSTALIHFLNNL